jgi:hypothetical protein
MEKAFVPYEHESFRIGRTLILHFFKRARVYQYPCTAS